MRTFYVLLPFALAACTATPLDYHSYTEIPRGPGLFTGKDGAFVLEAKGLPGAAPVPVKSAPPTVTDEEYREFQEWREWRRAREEAGKK